MKRRTSTRKIDYDIFLQKLKEKHRDSWSLQFFQDRIADNWMTVQRIYKLKTDPYIWISYLQKLDELWIDVTTFIL